MSKLAILACCFVIVGLVLSRAQQPVVLAGLNYQHVPTPTALTTVKTSTGILQAVIINAPATQPGCLLTLQDAAPTGPGNVIAIVSCSNQSKDLHFGVAFVNGLTVQAIGPSADITITFQ